MKTDITEVSTSIVVSWLRFPMAVLVVYIHLTPQQNPIFTPISGIDWTRLNFDNIYSILGVTINNIAAVAVPFFFFSSGYYFFYRTEFSKEIYVRKIKKRAKTLLIPYILWNIIAVLCRYLHGLWQSQILNVALTEKHSLSLEDIYSVPNWVSYMWNHFTISNTNGIDLLGLSGSFTAPADLPLWFLRDLIVLSVLTPLIYFAIKRGKYAFLIVLWIAYILNIETLAGINIIGLFFFSFGAYLSINKKDLLDTFLKYRSEGIIALIILLPMLLFMNGTKFEMAFNHIYCTVGIIAVVALAYKMSNKKSLRNFFLKKSNRSFFIYALHTLPIIITSPLGFGTNLLTKTFNSLCNSGGEGILTYLIAPIIGVVICLFCFSFLNRFFPKALYYLTGGRD